MKRICTCLILCLSAFSSPFSYCQKSPQKLAEDFYRSIIPERPARAEVLFDRITRFGSVWIFESTDPAGFVLVKDGDSDRLAGYSTDNLFLKEGTVPPPAGLLLEYIDLTPSSGLFPARPLKTVTNEVEPMLETRWGQDGYFNYYCPRNPDGPSGHTYAGCVAVAIGQIIKYFGKSNSFLFTDEIEDPVYGSLQATIGNYDWMVMENDPLTIDLEVSNLLYGMGIITGMKYSPTSSITSVHSAYLAFKKVNYLNACRLNRNQLSTEDWIDAFSKNLNEYKPVFVAGSGHAFVCDGQNTDGFLHFNLGWGGYADGYYPFNAVGSIYINEMICNLEPFSQLMNPVNLRKTGPENDMLIEWSDQAANPLTPLFYKVYWNDTVFAETPNCFYQTAGGPPGKHQVKVTAVYAHGESRWAGPLSVTVRGNEIVISDPAIKQAVNQALGIGDTITGQRNPFACEALELRQLELSMPVTSLEDLRSFPNLQVLSLNNLSDQPVSLRPLAGLRRLKRLEIRNSITTETNTLRWNDRIIELVLDHDNPDSLNFISYLTRLIQLSAPGTILPDPAVLSHLSGLEFLDLSQTGISQVDWISNLMLLTELNAEGNEIGQITLNRTNPSLSILKLRGNRLGEVQFLDELPGLTQIDISNNKLGSFIISSNLPKLEKLDISQNIIDTIRILNPLPDLTRFDASNNRIRSLDRIQESVPGIINLDFSDNRIDMTWKGGLHSAERIDLSGNRIIFADFVINQPKVKEVDLSRNGISDLSALTDGKLTRSLRFLSVAGNPLSMEALNDQIPVLKTMISNVIHPATSQTFSPCYPDPGRLAGLEAGERIMTWQCANLPDQAFYRVYAGNEPGRLKEVAGPLLSPGFTLDIKPGKKYYWYVSTVTPDSAYSSGLYSFRSYIPVELPYYENYESYSEFTCITDNNTAWISGGESASHANRGRIYPYRSMDGENSLKLENDCFLELPLDHVTTDNLTISQFLLVDKDRRACFRVNDVNGLDLKFFFRPGWRLDILYGEQKLGEFEFPRSEWFRLKISISGKNNWATITLNSKYLINLPVAFPNGQVSVAGIAFTDDISPYQTGTCNSSFYSDILEIKKSGSSPVFLEEQPEERLIVYPNPAGKYLEISFDGGIAAVSADSMEQMAETMLILDMTGRQVKPSIRHIGPGQISLDLTGLKKGMYFIKLGTQKKLHNARFMIAG